MNSSNPKEELQKQMIQFVEELLPQTVQDLKMRALVTPMMMKLIASEFKDGEIFWKLKIRCEELLDILKVTTEELQEATTLIFSKKSPDHQPKSDTSPSWH